MKKITTLILLFIYQLVNSQAIYNSGNYASIGSNFTTSKTNVSTSSLDFTLTGANYIWDYSTLNVNTQESKTWIDPNTTGYKTTWCISNGYFANCNTNFNNAFNLATQVLDGIEFSGYGLTNLVSHYKKTVTSLENKMLGGTIIVGAISIPMTINYNVPDIEYLFPIQYNDNYTNNSQFQIDLNSLGIPVQYSSNAQRTNLVEGWGTLATPYMTFNNVLKMKTTIVNNETIITTTGTTTTNRTTITYKWFDPSYGIPVLEISGEQISGVWIPTTATYIDIPQCLTPVALFGYLPIVPDYEPTTQSVDVSFINSSSNYDTVVWDFGDGSTSTESNPTHTYVCPGLKQVMLTVTNTFCEPDLIQSITIPLNITDSQNSFTTDIVENSGTLTAVRDLPGTTYQWIDCDNSYQEISGEINQSFTPTLSGNYAVQLITNGCTSVSNCFPFSTLSSNQFDFQDKNISIFPNPTTGKFEIRIDSNEQYDTVEVYDLLGNKIEETLDLSAYQSGIYILKIELNGKYYHYKLVKK